MIKEICICNAGINKDDKQTMFNAKTNEVIEDAEWLDLIGARITRIRRESFPEKQIVLTLFKM